MPTGAKVTVTGGRKFGRVLREARALDPPDIEVGFFETARYPRNYTGKARRTTKPMSRRQAIASRRRTPHYVATVAAWQEYGTRRGTPERPFFRNALTELAGDRSFKELLENVVEWDRRRVSAKAASLVGLYVASKVQESIRKLREPPNAPITIKRKQSSNPLIDVGIMRTAVTYKVNDQ